MLRLPDVGASPAPALVLVTDRGIEHVRRLERTLLGASELAALQAAAAGAIVPAEASGTLSEVLGAAVPCVGAQEVGPRLGGTALTPVAIDPPAVPSSSSVLVAAQPRLVAVTGDGFVWFGPSGSALRPLSAAELHVLATFAPGSSVAQAYARQQVDVGAGALPEPEFRALVTELCAAGALRAVAPAEAEVSAPPAVRHVAFAQRKALISAGNELLRRPGAPGRVSVIALYEDPTPVNLALGLLLAHASAFDGGRLLETYELLPVWVASIKAIRRRLEREGPAIFLFSNYVWSIDHNLALSAAIKELSPESVCIHGGPSTPKYPDDAVAFFAANPAVDVAVRGEGEQTFVEILDALGGKLAGRAGDLSLLDAVPGLTYRTPRGPVRTGERERMADLDAVPSPYLAGYFADMAARGIEFLPIETNRGCPYGCTFCDWGSATNSRIRKFDLERVFAEIEWGARHEVETVFVIDANFGIFARDVEIAAKVVECRERYGFPKQFYCCFAKNTTKYTSQICQMLWDAGIGFFPVIALQSMDDDVLAVVDRSNIKTAAYDDLAGHLRGLGATVFVELMMGLPGSSLATFANDLQGCIDREVYAVVYDTMVLPNSPMNAPEYREAHRLEIADVAVGEGATRRLVAASATFTRADYDLMRRRRHLFRVFEDGGALRHLARWVRQEAGVREIDFYDALGDRAIADPDAWPSVHWLMHDTVALVAPLSWAHLLGEVRSYLVDELGVVPSSAMTTAFEVQNHLLPDIGRVFPSSVDLPHDYAAWYGQVREAGPGWWEVVPPLASFGPARFEVTGTPEKNALIYGSDLLAEHTKFAELDSPVMRGSWSGAAS